jgi:hypothetical protein
VVARRIAASNAKTNENKKEIEMKLSRISTTLLGASLFFAAGAFAQEKSTLNLVEKVNIQGTELKPGRYEVKWEGSGPNVQVSISQGKNTLGTFPATVVARDTSIAGGGYESKKETDGSKSIVAIYPNGKKIELEIAQSQAAGGR